MKVKFFALITCLVLSAFAHASTSYSPSLDAYDGFIKIREGHELYVRYVKAKPKMPTVVLLNGLTYSTVQWDNFVAPLVNKGVGVVRYDMFGMGETLLKYAPTTATILVADQVEDLNALLTVMKIKGPYNIVGLSYGGGVAAGFAAAYPSKVNNIVMMAPYTRPLEGQDQWIRSQIWATRQIFPFNRATDDELYQYFLRQIVYSTYPQAEPVVLQNPFILESVFRLTDGIRKYRPIDYVSALPAKSLHLMVARQDQYIQTAVLEEYWDAVPTAARASLMYINGSEHKIVEAVPRFAATWVYEILKGNSKLFKGDTFEGYPYRGEIRTGNETIRTVKE